MSTAMEILAGLVLEDGRLWGQAAVPWQWADAAAVLDGPQRMAFLTRPRGGSKTTDLAGVGIAALLDQLPPESRSYAVAVDKDQGRLLVDSILGFVARTPGLRGALRVDRWVVTNDRTGATLEVLPADAASAWGLRPHLLIIDERAQWPTTAMHAVLWSALWSALPKVATSRLVILTSAGDPAHPSYKQLERARRDPAWYVNEVPGPTPWIAPADLEQQRAGMTESEYQRLHENIWCAPEDRLTSLDALRACVVLDGPLRPEPGISYAVGVDIGLKNDRTVACVVHGEPLDADGASTAARSSDSAVTGSWIRPSALDQYLESRRSDRVVDIATFRRPDPDRPERRGTRIVLDRIEVWSGTRKDPVRLSDVEAWILQAHQVFNRAKVVMDPWQAAGMAQRLRDRNVKVEEYNFSSGSVGRLANTLHLLLRDRALALPDDEELLDELLNVRLRETSPGVLRMENAPGQHDDRAIALALAAQEILNRPPVQAVTQFKYKCNALRGTR